MDTLRPFPTLPATPREFGFYINGQWQGGRPLFDRASPGHGVPVTRIPKCTPDDLNAAVTAARTAFEDRRWAGLSGAARRKRSAARRRNPETPPRRDRLLGNLGKRQTHRPSHGRD